MEFFYVLLFSIVFSTIVSLLRLAFCGALPNLGRALARVLKQFTAPSEAIVLQIPHKAAAPAPPQSLCETCTYSHIARGYRPGQTIVLCGYAFPPRDVLFAVRECSDFKPKRTERRDATKEPEPAAETKIETLSLQDEPTVTVSFRSISGEN